MFAPRIEYKYRVDEETAVAVRDYVASHLEPDRHVVDSRTNCYPVNNLYLDSDDLSTYLNGVNDSKNRFKLRVRSYDDHNPDAPLFLEIKRKVNDETIKTRGAIRRSSLDALLAGDLPMIEDVATSSEADLRAVMEFVEHVRAIDAKPRAHVRYLREAWVSPDSDALRLTMDRDVLVAPKWTTDFLTDQMDAPTLPFGNTVVLEIKITGKAPFWFVDLEQTAGLRRGSAAKYCDGVLARGEASFSQKFVAPVDLNCLIAIENRRRKLELPPSRLPGREFVAAAQKIA
jgi:hypothetical protein